MNYKKKFMEILRKGRRLYNYTNQALNKIDNERLELIQKTLEPFSNSSPTTFWGTPTIGIWETHSNIIYVDDVPVYNKKLAKKILKEFIETYESILYYEEKNINEIVEREVRERCTKYLL